MFAVLFIPQFSLQAILRHEPGLWTQPVALVDPALRVPLVCDMTEAARRAGIAPGLTPTQAMARCGEVLIRNRSPEQETVARNSLLQCAYGFSPYLEATEPGLCTLDLRGLNIISQATPARWRNWSEKLQCSVAGLGLSVSVGIGATPQIAQQAARWGNGREVVDDPKTFIATLPLEALNPSTDARSILQRWGIRNVGELLALGQDALCARLGLEALALFAAASCTTIRPLHLICPAESFEESFQFDPEIDTLEPLLFLLRRFVDQLTQRLEPRGFVAETLVLQLVLESGQKLVSRLRLPQPTRESNVLFRTLHTHLETVRTDSLVQSVRLTIVPVQGTQKQLGLFETTLMDPHQFQETLARLAAALGSDRVGTPALENSHRPDTFRLTAPDFENAPVPDSSQSPSFSHVTPIRRFRPPITAEVECDTSSSLHAARPISIRCALAQGKLKVLIGPWRASGQWWDPTGWEREEWDAATQDGQVIRLVRQPDGWFVEGVVD